MAINNRANYARVKTLLLEIKKNKNFELQILLGASAMIVLSSCVSKKQFTDLQAKQKETQDLLNSATVKLNTCLEDRASATAKVTLLEGQVEDLKKYNDNLQVLSAKGASNVEKTLESIK